MNREQRKAGGEAGAGKEADGWHWPLGICFPLDFVIPFVCISAAL